MIITMSESAKRLATYDDLLALPDDVRGQVVAGEVIVSPSPTPLHQSVLAEIYSELRGPFQRGRGGPGGWWLIPDVDVRFGPHDIFRPDISGWRRESVPEFPMKRPVIQRPDWVCEGLSPRTAVVDQGIKRNVYASAGVPWYWLVEPANRSLTVLRLSPEGYVMEVVVGESDSAHLPPFDAIECEVALFFPPPRADE